MRKDGEIDAELRFACVASLFEELWRVSERNGGSGPETPELLPRCIPLDGLRCFRVSCGTWGPMALHLESHQHFGRC